MVGCYHLQRGSTEAQEAKSFAQSHRACEWQGQDFSCTIWLQSLCSWLLTVLSDKKATGHQGSRGSLLPIVLREPGSLSQLLCCVWFPFPVWHFCCSVLECPGRTRPFRLLWSLGSSFVKHVQIVGELLSWAFVMGFIFFFSYRGREGTAQAG